MSPKNKGNEVKDLLSQLRSAAEVIKQQIHEADRKIEVLLVEREALCEARLTKEDFMAYIRNDIQRRAMTYAVRLKNAERKKRFTFGVSFSQLERNEKAFNTQPLPYLDGEDYSDGSSIHPGALYWIFGDQIEKRFSDALDQFDWPEGGLSLEERRARLEAIDQELETLNAERDNLANDLMSAGMAQ